MNRLLGILKEFRSKIYFNSFIASCCILGGYAFILLMDKIREEQAPFITLCAFKNLTGIPCPGCGMGRATIAFFKGDFGASFSYHILAIPFTFLVGISLCFLVIDVIKKKNTFYMLLPRRIKFIYLIPFLSLILFSWILNIIRGI